ncbi:MAG: DUF1772 domain-containing protein [Chloroflexi bacterium]|nr:DUF1772 domain-containing protein [Chloroflexota bacterium]
MIDSILPILVLLAALGCALMAGLFFTFSNFVMRALARLQAPQGVAAMQLINIVILNPLFFLVFMGTAVLSLVLPVSLLWRTAHANEIFVIGGSLSYLVGVMAVTIVRNVPMNNALEVVEPTSDEANQLWQQYLVNWTRWNHVRSVTSFLGTLFFILALT